MGRKVGARIREVLEIVEAGAKTKPEIRQRMNPSADPQHVGMYCSRAVGLGLMTVDRRKFPMEFRVVSHWRALVAESGAVNPAVHKSRHSFQGVNSVFALGAA